jgi:hypothetical protein
MYPLLANPNSKLIDDITLVKINTSTSKYLGPRNASFSPNVGSRLEKVGLVGLFPKSQLAYLSLQLCQYLLDNTLILESRTAIHQPTMTLPCSDEQNERIEYQMVTL